MLTCYGHEVRLPRASSRRNCRPAGRVALGADHTHGGRGADRRRVRTVEVDSERASTGPPRPIVVGLHELGVRMIRTQDLAKHRQGLLLATDAEIASPFRRELAASRGTR